eukprot:m.728187 g.728187  ORF g.728187 m.728187 type:complete len:493 (+) comp23045_c0_seq3:231-1709(+)
MSDASYDGNGKDGKDFHDSESATLFNAARVSEDCDGTDAKSHPSIWRVNILLFLCGLTTFARTEAFLLQMKMFETCLGYGDIFYPIATAMLFAPATVVLYSLRYAEQNLCATTERGITECKPWLYVVARRKIVISNVTAAVAILLFFGLPVLGTPIPHSIGYALLLFLGAGATIQFQTFSRLASAFPEVCMSYFIVGTYCPFVLFGPLNIGLGELCHPHNDSACVSGNISTTATTATTAVESLEQAIHAHIPTSHDYGGDTGTDDPCLASRVSWEDAWVFFGVAVVLSLSTILMFSVFGRLAATRYYLAREERRMQHEFRVAQPSAASKRHDGTHRSGRHHHGRCKELLYWCCGSSDDMGEDMASMASLQVHAHTTGVQYYGATDDDGIKMVSDKAFASDARLGTNPNDASAQHPVNVFVGVAPQCKRTGARTNNSATLVPQCRILGVENAITVAKKTHVDARRRQSYGKSRYSLQWITDRRPVILPPIRTI